MNQVILNITDAIERLHDMNHELLNADKLTKEEERRSNEICDMIDELTSALERVKEIKNIK